MTAPIGIVIASFCDAPAVAACLARLPGASRRAVDILVVDDGSDAATVEALRGVISEASRTQRGPVTLHAVATNLGPGHSFAIGMRHLADRGAEYLWLLDQDMLAQPGSLDVLVDALEHQHGPRGAVPARSNPDHEYVYAENVRVGRSIRPRPYRRLRSGQRLACCAYGGLLLHRSCLELGVEIPQSYFIDWDDLAFTYLLCRRGATLTWVREARVEHASGRLFRRQLLGWARTFPLWAPFRYYTMARNRVHFVRLTRGDLSGWWRATRSFPLRLAGSILFGDPPRLARLRAFWAGLRAGRRGETGRPPNL